MMNLHALRSFMRRRAIQFLKSFQYTTATNSIKESVAVVQTTTLIFISNFIP